MEIFLSWSGDESRAVAKSLKEWLPLIFQSINPWLSSSDISPGDRWANKLASVLDKIDIGIISLTPDNLEAPWVLFEAGALSKSLKSGRIIPFLFHVNSYALKGPLAQFHAVDANKEGTRKLVHAINKLNPSSFRREQTLDTVFEAFWPDLRDEFDMISEKFSSEKLRVGQIKVLTQREKEVLTYLIQDKEISDIANLLFISGKTVHKHIHNLKSKLEAGSTSEIKQIAKRLDLT